uniref:CSON012075 protein n=1 Tax=Culicoides sonorensis TaxID=179676 RepID=A0A336M5C6_CULSO
MFVETICAFFFAFFWRDKTRQGDIKYGWCLLRLCLMLENRIENNSPNFSINWIQKTAKKLNSIKIEP